MPVSQRKRNWWKIILFPGVLFVLLVIYVLYFLPLPDSILVGPRSGETTKMYDRNGVLLYEVLHPEEGKRTNLNFEQFPKHLLEATIAAEDSNFYAHSGVDLGAVLRAIWLNLKHEEIISGASTIPQQLIRNLIGTTTDRSWGNKILESVYALRLSQVWSKNEVLAKYLNTVYYGNLNYGSEAAALNYFDKHVYDLDLAEISLLAGIPKNPTLYNPFTHLDDARERQAEVLKQMQESGFISKEEEQSAQTEELVFSQKSKRIKAPHFVYYLLDQLEEKLGKERLLYGGLKIYTTLDIYLQEEIERIVQNNIAQLQVKHVTNGAVLVTSNAGEIIAMVGSKDFYDPTIDGQVNVVLRKRQPGSTFKPITYLAALEKGWTPATTIEDIPVKYVTEEGTPYTPQNYDLDYHGLVTVREALANSYNIPAVKALSFAGAKNVLLLAKSLGITSLDRDVDFYGLALTLGDGEVRLLDLLQVYLTLANQGVKKPLVSILKSEPSISELQRKDAEERILPADVVYLITNILSDNSARLPSFGENSVLDIKNVAAKTGTSRNFKDNWTMGYSPLFTVGVWVGNSDASAMINVSGVEGAGPIFQDVVQLLKKTYGDQAFEKPSDVVTAEICLPSGKLPSDICPQRRVEVFKNGTEPKEQDTFWQEKNGQLVLSLPLELRSWAKKKGYAVATDTSRKNYLKIENPQNLDEFKISRSLPRDIQKITLRAAHSSDVGNIEWLMNGKVIGSGEELPWTLQPGNFEITAKSGKLSDSVSITVGSE